MEDNQLKMRRRVLSKEMSENLLKLNYFHSCFFKRVHTIFILYILASLVKAVPCCFIFGNMTIFHLSLTQFITNLKNLVEFLDNPHKLVCIIALVWIEYKQYFL